VTRLLVEDASSKQPSVRLDAARSLIDLQDWGRAAQLLGDDDVNVRSSVACRLLAAVH